MLIRRERPEDVERIDVIHRLAFADVAPADSDPVEVGLVRALRADAGWNPALSLVAEIGEGQVIGHVVGTEGSVDDTPAIGLGPIGVLPEQPTGTRTRPTSTGSAPSSTSLGVDGLFLWSHGSYER